MLMYEHFEEAVKIESEIEQLQAPLIEAEEKEMEYFTEMTEIAELEELEKIAKEAIESAEKRKQLMDEEKEKIEASYEEFQQAILYIEDIEMEDVKEKAESLVSVMEERYRTYEQLYNYYVDSVEADLVFYEMIYDEDVTIDQLEEQLAKINELYHQINEQNKKFNELTTEYNEMKKRFYEVAELNVVFDEEEKNE